MPGSTVPAFLVTIRSLCPLTSTEPISVISLIRARRSSAISAIPISIRSPTGNDRRRFSIVFRAINLPWSTNAIRLQSLSAASI